MSLECLPRDMKYYILVYLPLNDLIDICSGNKTWAKNLDDDIL